MSSRPPSLPRPNTTIACSRPPASRTTPWRSASNADSAARPACSAASAMRLLPARVASTLSTPRRSRHTRRVDSAARQRRRRAGQSASWPGSSAGGAAKGASSVPSSSGWRHSVSMAKSLHSASWPSASRRAGESSTPGARSARRASARSTRADRAGSRSRGDVIGGFCHARRARKKRKPAALVQLRAFSSLPHVGSASIVARRRGALHVAVQHAPAGTGIRAPARSPGPGNCPC